MSGSREMTTSCLARIRNSWNKPGDDSADQHDRLRLRDFRGRLSGPGHKALGMETSEPTRTQRQNALPALVPRIWDHSWALGSTACIGAIFLTPAAPARRL